MFGALCDYAKLSIDKTSCVAYSTRVLFSPNIFHNKSITGSFPVRLGKCCKSSIKKTTAYITKDILYWIAVGIFFYVFNQTLDEQGTFFWISPGNSI